MHTNIWMDGNPFGRRNFFLNEIDSRSMKRYICAVIFAATDRTVVLYSNQCVYCVWCQWLKFQSIITTSTIKAARNHHIFLNVAHIWRRAGYHLDRWSCGFFSLFVSFNQFCFEFSNIVLSGIIASLLSIFVFRLSMRFSIFPWRR